MSALRVVVFLGILAALSPAPKADEVVHFTNGTYMRILSHEILGDMVRVRLDGAASLTFPSRQVERIEGFYGVVYNGPESKVQANQALPGPAHSGPDTPYPVRVDPALATRGRSDAPRPVDPQSTGVSPSPSFADGSIMATRRAGPTGTERLGNRIVVDSGKGAPFRPVPFQAKPGFERSGNASSSTAPESAPDVRVLPPSHDDVPSTPVEEPPAESEPDPGDGDE
jgi:hypothetical protein